MSCLYRFHDWMNFCAVSGSYSVEPRLGFLFIQLVIPTPGQSPTTASLHPDQGPVPLNSIPNPPNYTPSQPIMAYPKDPLINPKPQEQNPSRARVSVCINSARFLMRCMISKNLRFNHGPGSLLCNCRDETEREVNDECVIIPTAAASIFVFPSAAK